MSLPSPSPQDRMLSDEALLPRICRGETELFEILMRRHNQKVYRTVRAILHEEPEVEDAMQQTYLSAFASLGQFQGASQFSTWLIRIAINEASGRRQRALRVVRDDRPLENMPVPPDPSQNPEEKAATHELGNWLERAIDALPELYRTALVLRDVEGLSTQEVAHALGVSEDVVKTRLHRSRALIRERMETSLSATAEEAFSFHAPRCDRVVAAVMHALFEP